MKRLGNVFKLLVISASSAFVLGGCTELTFEFLDGNPATTSTCAFWQSEDALEFTVVGPDIDVSIGEALLCVECDSVNNPKVSFELNGAEITARCHSDGDPLYGVAWAAPNLAIGPPIGEEDVIPVWMVANAWVDDDYDTTPDGPTEGDSLVCHDQSAGFLGKTEWKCTSEMKGNGKDGGVTFEVELKFDEVPTLD